METLSQLQRKKQSLEAQNSLGLAQCPRPVQEECWRTPNLGQVEVLSLSVHSNICGLKAPQKVPLALQEAIPLPIHSLTHSTSIPYLPRSV